MRIIKLYEKNYNFIEPNTLPDSPVLTLSLNLSGYNKCSVKNNNLKHISTAYYNENFLFTFKRKIGVKFTRALHKAIII